MRDFIDAVLEVIECESLTDDEFDTLEIETAAYDKETYTAIRTILEARENVSNAVKRLKLYFIARGADLSSSSSVPTPNSNIFIGAGLE